MRILLVSLPGSQLDEEHLYPIGIGFPSTPTGISGAPNGNLPA